MNFNKNCIIVKADVTKLDEVKKLRDTVINRYKRIDILINNAGICDDNYCAIMSYKKWQKVLDTNINSVFLCSKIFSKDMIYNKKGKILNISSLKGQLGSESQSNYSASKAAVIGFTKAFAKEMGHFNISINAICPGYIPTDLNKNNNKKANDAYNMSVLSIEYCCNDLINFIVFMSSDMINGVSGRVFNIDSRIN